MAMGVEIERKFLVRSAAWRDGVQRSRPIVQGYLAAGARAGVRVRVAGDQAWITIKGRRSGIARAEFEYPVPAAEARQMLEQLAEGESVRKTRHWVEHAGQVWEVDEFEGENRGLVLAEIELERIDQEFAHPPWLGAEVSEDPRYYNAYLAQHPYRSWR